MQQYLYKICTLTSITLWYNSWDILLNTKSKVKHVCGAVLPGQWVKHLCVNPDLDVYPFCVTNLTEQ